MNDRTTRGLVLAVAVTAPLVIATSGAISYSSLYQLALVVGGFSGLEAHLFPFPVDFTLGGAVAASFLLARWGTPWGPRSWVALQVAASAVVTISGNALHATIVGDAHAWPSALRLAVSAVPGAAIVFMTHTVTIMLRCRPGAAHQARAAKRPPRAERRQVERDPGARALRPSAGMNKESRLRALLDDGGIGLLDGPARAALIARAAADVEGSKSYVRKIAASMCEERARTSTGLEQEGGLNAF
jgi:hypothetical protein